MLDLKLPRDYEAELVREIPGSGNRLFYYKGESKAADEPAILIRVTPRKSQRWVGAFTHGYASPPAFTGVFASSRPDHLVVVAGGQSYVVDVEAPERWWTIDAFPICAAIQVSESGLLLLGTFTEAMAWDGKDIIWRRRVSDDGVSLEVLTDSVVIAHGLSVRAERQDISNALDVRTGNSLDQEHR